jgi:ribosome-interacting GTPase 1
MAKDLNYANATGESAKFRNQKVGGEHVLKDGDVVTLVYEKFAG